MEETVTLGLDKFKEMEQELEAYRKRFTKVELTTISHGSYGSQSFHKTYYLDQDSIHNELIDQIRERDDKIRSLNLSKGFFLFSRKLVLKNLLLCKNYFEYKKLMKSDTVKSVKEDILKEE